MFVCNNKNQHHSSAKQVRAVNKQQGIAVITVLLVIALTTITVATMTSRQQIDIRREQNEAAIQLARSLAISGERFAAATLYRDFQTADRNNTDSLEDDWSQTLPPIPVDGATLTGCIVDMQGKFNLNNLVNGEGEAEPIYVDQFTRLLEELGIDKTKAQTVVDWIDEDINATLPDGAEDDYYTGLDLPYRTSNTDFSSISELQLVKGFSPSVEEENADYELLVPHIAALPTDGGPLALNVNTATPELLSSMSGVGTLGGELSRWDTAAYADYPACENFFDLEAEEAEGALTADRDYTPYESTLDFDSEAAVESGEVVSDTAYNVFSRYFQVRIDIAMEGVTLSQYTLMERDEEGKVRLVSRLRDVL